jgi:tetratricopeptide (TPR) repeat protein
VSATAAQAVPARTTPADADRLVRLGLARWQHDDPAGAAAAFAEAAAVAPGHAGAHNNLGNALRALGREEEAVACYRRTVALRPDLAGAHTNLGLTLLALHRPREAAGAFRAALRCQPNDADTCNNLGGALLALDRPGAAIGWFRRALARDPTLAEARFGESLALLALGRFRAGWAAYESRWQDPRFLPETRHRGLPQWRGPPSRALAGRTLLLHAEQGFGDTLQFVRYVPLLRRLGARVVLEVETPLLRLFDGIADALIPAGADVPHCDFCCPLLSLPYAFRTTRRDIPAAVPYLAAPPALRRRWRARLGARDGRLRVGLVLSGSATHPDDALRSLPAAAIRPLLALPGLDLHLVQPALRAEEAVVLRGAAKVRRHAGRLTDFAETAALLSALDLLVSVDTAAAHLGGALGMPVWLLLPAVADFRWLRGRGDSPWYPTMRLFRQDTPGDWAPVIDRVAAALAAQTTTSAPAASP